MSVAVQFDYKSFIARYSEFLPSGSYKGVSEPLAAEFFKEAQIYHDNSGKPGGVQNAAQQSVLLNMLTAHIALLSVGSQNQPATGLVGRISDATEGSVSASVDMPTDLPGSAAWFTQTQYGFSYWSATRQYRTGLFAAPFCRTLPGPL